MGQIEIADVTRTFGSTDALSHVDLVAEDGEFLVLLGPSGCGKSTLLRLVAGLDTPTSGRILVDGRDVTALPPGDRDLAVVFQSYALYPHMTVRRNLAFPLLMERFRWWHHVPLLHRHLYRRELRDPVIASQIEAAAEMLAITELLDRHPRTLSGGQRQRVALGRALVRDPVAFLMDEPLSNLDAKLRLETRHEILALHRRTGRTTLYVTHDQVEAMTMGTRVVVLRKGVIQQQGPPNDIYRDPENLFVAQFLGSPPMNILPGRWYPDRGGLEVDAATVPVRPADPVDEAFARRGVPDVSVGVRAEDLVVLPVSAGTGCRSHFTATVELREEVGHETLLGLESTLHHDSTRAIVGPSAHRIFARQQGDGLPLGSAVSVGVRPGARISLFDPQSERRVAVVTPDASGGR